MDWNDTPAQAAFRDEVRAFVAERLPKRYQRDAEGFPSRNDWLEDRKSGDPERQAADAEWSAALRDKGWLAPHWPKEYGGAGMGPSEQFVFNMEMTEAEVPTAKAAPQVPGLALLGPTLMIHGTEEQKQQHAGLQRAGRGLGPRVAEHARHAGRRRLRGQRPEDLDIRGTVRGLDLRPRPDRPGCAEAPRHLVLDDGRDHPGHHGAAADQHG